MFFQVFGYHGCQVCAYVFSRFCYFGIQQKDDDMPKPVRETKVWLANIFMGGFFLLALGLAWLLVRSRISG